MNRLIHERRAEIAVLCRRYGVRHLEVFGSAARGDDFDPAEAGAGTVRNPYVLANINRTRKLVCEARPRL